LEVLMRVVTKTHNNNHTPTHSLVSEMIDRVMI
jgi:hypothetical protein